MILPSGAGDSASLSLETAAFFVGHISCGYDRLFNFLWSHLVRPDVIFSLVGTDDLPRKRSVLRCIARGHADRGSCCVQLAVHTFNCDGIAPVASPDCSAW
jgi:hypothetical protein